MSAPISQLAHPASHAPHPPVVREEDAEPRALEVVEEAVALLKRAGLAAYAAYAAGTLGFLWAFLYFWAYMSRNALAEARLSEFSLLLAAAFAIMKFCHALFFRRLMAVLENAETGPPTPGLLARTALAQTLLQPLALIAVPVAFLLTIPYPFVCAFFQTAHWLREGDGVGAWLGRSARVSRLWPKQNMYLHLFLAGAALCVFANLFSGLVAVPMLLKSLLGVDTVFSRSPSAYLNSTFVLMVFALTWAAIDPLAKAVNAWRCFHGLSRRTGLDLRLALDRLSVTAATRRPGAAPVAAALVLVLSLGGAAAETHGPSQAGREPASASAKRKKGASEAAKAAAKPAPAPEATRIDPATLDALLKEEIADSRYGWRLPRHAGSDVERSWLYLQLRKAYHGIRHSIRSVETAWRRFEDWFNGLFMPKGKDKPEAAPAPPSRLPTRILILGLVAMFAVAVAFFLVKRARTIPVRLAAPVRAVPKAPDVSREDVKADDFPEEEWLRLMERLRAEGQHRLALRALFLAMLSLLARRGWVTVARHKSNRDYQREVSARARRLPAVPESFRENCRVFDRVWYGAYEITGADWETSQANFAKVRSSDG